MQGRMFGRQAVLSPAWIHWQGRLMTSAASARPSATGAFLKIAGVILPCLGCCGTAIAVTRADEPSGGSKLFSFTPDQRTCIDDGCLWCPREKRNVSRVEAYGNALKWLVARTPLPIDEEMRRAAEKDEELKSKSKTSAAPAAAEKVFRKLVETLPARMRPTEYEFTLTVVDPSEAEGFSVGAGRVYVSASALRVMLADDRFGRDQLSFVLAHELG